MPFLRHARIGRAILVIALILTEVVCFASTPRVRQVRVEGNLRIPTDSILHYVSMSPNAAFDASLVQADLKKLSSLGVFDSVEVHTDEVAEGLSDVIFRVVELPFVSEFVIEGVKGSVQDQIRELLRKEKLEIRSARPFQPVLGKKVSVAAVSYLRAHKYPKAEAEIVEERGAGTVRVVLRIQTGPQLEVGQVLFNGNASLSDEELAKQMRRTRAAPIWAPLSRLGAYVPEDLSADLERVRRHYQSRGYAAAILGKPEVEIRKFRSSLWMPLPKTLREKEKLLIRIPVIEGSRYQLASVRVDSDARTSLSEVFRIPKSLAVPGDYNFSLLESARQKMLAALGSAGYALAEVQLEQATDSRANRVHAVYKIDSGLPVLVGDIRFEGNQRLPDKFLRREVRLREGELFDSSKLDESIERLNRSHLVQELRRTDVCLRLDEARNALDITFKVKERERQGLYATGGTGGMSGGYLGILYTAFNYLGLGEALRLQLDGGAAQSNLLVNLAARQFLGSPFLLALSGFHRYANLNIANIVPGPEDLVALVRRRTAGFGTSVGYPITSSAQFGLGFQLERQSVVLPSDAGKPPNEAVNFGKFELIPSFAYDSTRGSGAQTRGAQWTLSHAWIGTPLLGSVEAVRPSVQYERSLADPWTRGQNSFGFRVHASAVRPQGDNALSLGKRFFPGDEIVRGFRSGSLSTWTHVPETDHATLRPAGADTVLGFSGEYRVPLRGALSSAAYVDFGWTRLNSHATEEFEKGARLLADTSGVLRASTGGELRLELPVIRQPARLIFAWNPLRLESLLATRSSLPLRLADPRGSVRFALGNLF